MPHVPRVPRVPWLLGVRGGPRMPVLGRSRTQRRHTTGTPLTFHSFWSVALDAANRLV